MRHQREFSMLQEKNSSLIHTIWSKKTEEEVLIKDISFQE